MLIRQGQCVTAACVGLALTLACLPLRVDAGRGDAGVSDASMSDPVQSDARVGGVGRGAQAPTQQEPTVAGGAASIPSAAIASRGAARALLAKVGTWGCQYQSIELDRLAATTLDLIVIDPVLDGGTGRMADPEDLAKLRRKPDGSRRLVLAYLSIGAAEEYRAYWLPGWQAEPPSWLGAHNPAWPRSYSVQYWQPDWRRIVDDGLQRIVAAGFDGVFMDRVDAYHDWSGRASAHDDMVDFVVQLSQSARRSQPGFLFVGQNAEQLLVNQRYREAIDGVSKESLLTGLHGPGTPNTVDDIAWSMAYLAPAQGAGLTILAIEYLDTASDIEAARQRLRAMRFKPFFAHRLLDRLP